MKSKRVDDCKMIKVTCADAKNNVCREELPVFTNNVPHGLLLILFEKSLAMIKPETTEEALIATLHLDKGA